MITAPERQSLRGRKIFAFEISAAVRLTAWEGAAAPAPQRTRRRLRGCRRYN